MRRLSFFADESGDFVFLPQKGSRYFILTTVAMADCSAISASLIDLRHRLAWEGHEHPGALKVTLRGDQLLVVAASIGTKKKRRAFYAGVRDVMEQVASVECKTACWDAAADPCLQVADYCGWAIQRKWESGNGSAHEKIQEKIRSEYEIFRVGTTRYY